VPWHEPPGWRGGRKPNAPATSPSIRGSGPGGSLTPDERARQSAADRARQPPPAAWRFYHCYTGGELAAEASAGAAAATAEAARAGEADVAYAAGGAFLDRGNWCVEVRRVHERQ
jgi:hypothetical protein